MSENVIRRARLIGLISIVAAIAGIGVLLLFDLGCDSFTRLQQLSLLLAAAVLWTVHMPLDFWLPVLEQKASSRAKGNSASQGQKIVRSYEFGSNA